MTNELSHQGGNVSESGTYAAQLLLVCTVQQQHLEILTVFYSTVMASAISFK